MSLSRPRLIRTHKEPIKAVFVIDPKTGKPKLDLAASLDAKKPYEPVKSTEPDKPKNIKKKEKIPVAVRKIVWNTYIGKDNKSGKCMCCSTEDISISNFECGHITSEKKWWRSKY